MRSTVIAVAIRLAISASLAVSGAIHVYLYVNGYRDIPIVGPGFLGQAIVFCVMALLILGASTYASQRPSAVMKISSPMTTV
jgi:hypothetical protein